MEKRKKERKKVYIALKWSESSEIQNFGTDKNLLAHVDDAANAVTCLHVAKGLVDLVEGLAVSNELVDLEVALEVVGHKAGQLRAALDTTKSTALPYTASDELEWAGGNLLAGGGDTDDDGLSPSLVAGLESSAHDVDVACAVKGVVATAIGHFNKLLLDALAAELGGVDKVGRAKLLGPLFFGIVDINNDDLASLVLGSSLDD